MLIITLLKQRLELYRDHTDTPPRWERGETQPPVTIFTLYARIETAGYNFSFYARIEV